MSRLCHSRVFSVPMTCIPHHGTLMPPKRILISSIQDSRPIDVLNRSRRLWYFCAMSQTPREMPQTYQSRRTTGNANMKGISESTRPDERSVQFHKGLLVKHRRNNPPPQLSRQNSFLSVPLGNSLHAFANTTSATAQHKYSQHCIQ